MTPSLCGDTCRAGGYKYAGLQYAKEVCPSLFSQMIIDKSNGRLATDRVSATAVTRSMNPEKRLQDVRWDVSVVQV